MDKNSFVMYTEYLKHIQKLSMDQRGELFTAILCYASGEELPELDAAADMAFSFIKERMDRDNEAYLEKCRKRSEAGKLGGRPTAKANGSSEKQTKAKKANGFFEKQTKAKKPDTDNDTVTDTVTDKKQIMCDAAALFERLWKLYPCKKGKGQVSDTQKKRLLAIGEPALVKAIERYSSELQKDAGWRKPQNGSTFFNSGYVDYLDGNFVPDKEKPAEKSKNRFHNLESHDYDYDALVREMNGGEL